MMGKANKEKDFWAKVEKLSGGCWLFRGHLDKRTGYGIFCFEDTVLLAHRFAWMLTNGAIPKDKQLDHLCRIRDCVNPAHMEVVTRAENLRRGMSPVGINARKQFCVNGHPLNQENILPIKNGRSCRICSRERHVANRKRWKSLGLCVGCEDGKTQASSGHVLCESCLVKRRVQGVSI